MIESIHTIRHEKIDGAQMHSDVRYQRAIEEAHVKRLRREWEDAKVGYLTGSRRADGKIWLLDGLQRWSAKCGNDHDVNLDYVWDVQVYEGLTLEEEAELFVTFNKHRKNVSAYYVHKAAVVQGLASALAIEQVVAELGLNIGTKSTRTEVGCVSALNWCMGDGSPERVEATRFALGVYNDAWGEQPVLWRSEHIRALAAFYRKYGKKADRAVLVKRLSEHSPLFLLDKARARAVGSNNVVPQLVDVFADAYDRGKRNQHRLVPVAA